MDNSRVEILKQLLAENGSNIFARYGLAMEYVKAGSLDQAVAEFENILESDPAYSAAYFHGGQTLEKLGKLDEARDYYRRGLAASPDPHGRGELRAALDILGD